MFDDVKGKWITRLTKRWNRFFYNFYYMNYMNQYWPLVSYHRNDISVMNIAFPDNISIYHVASFSDKESVLLEGEYPENCLFWNLTFYDNMGKVTHCVNESDFPNRFYRILVSKVKSKTSVYQIFPPCSFYAVIHRMYTVTDEPFTRRYLPKISLCFSNVSYPSPEYRLMHSIQFQERFRNYVRWYTFFDKFRMSNNFWDVDMHQFFVPSVKTLKNVFANPQALYMIAFPKKNKIMRIQGILPSIGHDCLIQYSSFMACDLSSFGTDSSVSYFSHYSDYNIYVCFKDRLQSFSTKLSERDSVLTWENDNKKPMVVYRLIFSSFQEFSPKKIYSGQNVDHIELKDLFGIYFPQIFYI